MEEAGKTRSLGNRIRAQQAAYNGSIMRREGLEHIITMGRQGRSKDGQACIMDEHRKRQCQ